MSSVERGRLLAWLLAAACLLLVLQAPALRAQQPGGSPLGITVTADKYEYDLKTGRGYAKGNILLGYKDITVTADEAEWDPTGGDLLAKGNVVVKRGLFSWRGSEVTGNFRTREFKVGQYQATSGVLYISGASGLYHTDGTVVLGKAQLSTCEYLVKGEAHYSLDASEVEYHRNGDFVARNVVYRLFGVPVFWLPVIWGNTDKEGNGFEVKPGFSGAWGPYLLLAKSWRLNKEVTTKFRLDLRGRHGVAAGNETTITTKTFQTEALVYGMFDTNPPETDAGFNRRFEIVDTRYRAKLYHRQDILPDLNLRVRVDKLSDIDMLENWFKSEYRLDPQPKSLVDLTWERERFALSLTARGRVNNFFAEVEQLPSLRFQMPRQSLWDSGFFYQSDSSLSNLEMKWRDFDRPRPLDPPDLIDPADYKAVRFDSLHMLYYPFKIFDVIEAVPRAGFRLTYYSKSSKTPITTRDLDNMADVENPDNPDSITPVINYDARGGSVLRLAGETGLELSTKFYRTWSEDQVKSEYWDLHGLRHIVQPYVNYTLAPKPSQDREHLYFFDEIDRLIEQNFVRVGVNQRLETRRSNQIYTFASMDTYADFHFVKEAGFKNLGDFGTRLTVSPRETLRFWGSLKADMGAPALNRGELGVSVGREQDVKVNLSYLYRGSYDSRTVYSMGSSLADYAGDSALAHHFERNHYLKLGVGFPINPKTYFKIGYEYDIVHSRLARQSYEIVRDLHCWMGALRLEQEESDVSLMLILYLKAYPGFGVKTGL